MKILIVGLGVQGRKRIALLGEDAVATVDPFVQEADFRKLEEVPLDIYDSALLSIPDNQKKYLIDYLVRHQKDIIVEKPLIYEEEEWSQVEKVARENQVVVYTAYNHRFEPHFQNVQRLLESRAIGDVYYCKIFYGNGTARLVKDSRWRDSGLGVLADIGSHLLDTLDFWFGKSKLSNVESRLSRFENKAPDHALSWFEMSGIQFNLEMSLCSWKNSFECDIIGSGGSLHIKGLCKWGESSLISRTRKLPSGIPEEIVLVEPFGDPTWIREHEYFAKLVAEGSITDLSTDRWILESLLGISSAYQKSA